MAVDSRQTVTETLREALVRHMWPDASKPFMQDASLRIVRKGTGISISTISRFLHGGGIHSDHADALAEYLSLVLVKEQER